MPKDIYFRQYLFGKHLFFRKNFFSLILSIFSLISIFTKNQIKFFLSSKIFLSHFLDFNSHGISGVYLTGEKVADAVGVVNLPASNFIAQGYSLRGRTTSLYFLLAGFLVNIRQVQGAISTGEYERYLYPAGFENYGYGRQGSTSTGELSRCLVKRCIFLPPLRSGLLGLLSSLGLLGLLVIFIKSFRYFVVYNFRT